MSQSDKITIGTFKYRIIANEVRIKGVTRVYLESFNDDFSIFTENRSKSKVYKNIIEAQDDYSKLLSLQETHLGDRFALAIERRLEAF